MGRAHSGLSLIHIYLDSAADGRQRPWRARIIALSLTDVPGQPAAVRLASRMLVDNLRASWDETRARYQDRKSEYSAAWQAAAGEMLDVMHVTPDELNKVREQLLEIIAPYRRMDPAERPPAVLPIQVMLDMYPWFGPCLLYTSVRQPGAVDGLEHPRRRRGPAAEHGRVPVLAGQGPDFGAGRAQTGPADQDRPIEAERTCLTRPQPGSGRRGDADGSVCERGQQRPRDGVQPARRHDDDLSLIHI